MSSLAIEGPAWLLSLAGWPPGRSPGPLPSPWARRPPRVRASDGIGAREEIAARDVIAPCRKLAAVLASKRLPRWGWGMRFCVLGPLEAYADGRSVAVGGGRQRALLALLLVHAGEVVSRDRLIEELWAGKPPPGGSQSLGAYLSRLRGAFRKAGPGGGPATPPARQALA